MLDRLVARLDVNLIDGHMIGLRKRVHDRRRDVFGLKDARPAGLSIAPQRLIVAAPALFLHGGRDRVVPAAHGEWLARHCPSAELWLYPEDGHISVLNSGAAAAMGWLRKRAAGV